MQELNIVDLKVYTKDKEGNPLKTKDGRAYSRLVIKVKEYDKPLSGFVASWNENWRVGDVVKVLVEQKGEYLNFSKVDETDLLTERVRKLEENVKAIQTYLLNNEKVAPKDTDYPDNADESIPF